jgi:urease accessory protein
MNAFVGGVSDFFIPTHLLAVVALGLLAGQSRAILMLAVFAAGLAGGALTVASAIREVPSGMVLLILAAIAAGVVVLGRAIPPFVVAFLAGATGASIPLNAPPHEITIPAAIAAQCGLAAAAVMTLAVVTLVAANAARPWQLIGVRIVGSWVAASAILVIALRLTR